jgi:hypothetical protein
LVQAPDHGERDERWSGEVMMEMVSDASVIVRPDVLGKAGKSLEEGPMGIQVGIGAKKEAKNCRGGFRGAGEASKR